MQIVGKKKNNKNNNNNKKIEQKQHVVPPTEGDKLINTRVDCSTVLQGTNYRTGYL